MNNFIVNNFVKNQKIQSNCFVIINIRIDIISFSQRFTLND